MDQQELGELWDGQSLAAFDPAVPNGEVPEASAAESQPRVLGRIPDVQAAGPGSLASEQRGRADGRLISQGLSTKLLLGGGALLVLAAVVPFLLGKRTPEGEQPPAPNADVAPAFEPTVAQTPAAVPGPAPVEPISPNLNLQIDVPSGPGHTAVVPLPAVPGNPPPPTQAVEHHQARRPDPNEASRYGPPGGEAIQPQAQPNRKMKLHEPGPAQTVRYPEALGRDQAIVSHAGAAQPTWNHDPVQPGVARLQGIIVKPTVRTTDDRTRSSIH